MDCGATIRTIVMLSFSRTQIHERCQLLCLSKSPHVIPSNQTRLSKSFKVGPFDAEPADISDTIPHTFCASTLCYQLENGLYH